MGARTALRLPGEFLFGHGTGSTPDSAGLAGALSALGRGASRAEETPRLFSDLPGAV